jgi:membrane associated rhomboid family serine protease
VTPWVKRLIAANVIVFFLQLTMPAITNQLVFVPSAIVTRPWTVITYMFLHGGFGHIFFNMLGLFFFGPRLESRLGSDHFVILYFVSGLTGALLSAILAPHAAILGASAAVFGVMLGFAYFWPRDLIFIWGILPIQARWFVVIMTLFSLYSGVRGSTMGVADFAHLGGFVGAFLYLRWRAGAPTRFKEKTAPSVKDPRLGNWRKVNPQSVHEVNRDEVNRILDKISASGLTSLTPEEKIFLSNFVPPDDRIPPVS